MSFHYIGTLLITTTTESLIYADIPRPGELFEPVVYYSYIVANQKCITCVDTAFELLSSAFDGIANAMPTNDICDSKRHKDEIVAGSVCYHNRGTRPDNSVSSGRNRRIVSVS